VQLQEQPPATVITEAQRCAQRFTAATVAPRELPFLLSLAVLSKDTVRARAVIDRQLALAPTAADKASVLLTAMRAYLQARPIQLTAAAAVLARFDTVAPTMNLARVQGHEQLLEIASSVFDRAWMHREVATLRPLVQGLSVQQREEVKWFGSAQTRLWLFENGVDSAKAALGTLFKTMPTPQSELFMQRFGNDGPKLLARYAFAPVGQVVPPMPADSWSPNPGETPYPKPGQMTLIMRLGTSSATWHGQIASIATMDGFGGMREVRAMLARLYDRYGTKGLKILVVLQPGGYTPPVSQAQRFALTTQWFTTQFPFPVIVSQQVLPFVTRPLPDGRRIYQSDAIASDPIYKRLDNWPILLAGTNGTFTWAQINTHIEAELDAFIRQGLGLPPTPQRTDK
jgi:hypothetical protein